MSDLTEMHCIPYEGEGFTLDESQVRDFLGQVQNWKANESTTEIEKTFRFKNYYRTMAFVNVVAWVAHQEDHHPILKIGYNYCTVCYSTHSVGGLSKNDFICAAKLDALAASE